MKHFLVLFIGLFSFLNMDAQTIYKEITSEVLGEKRQIKIQLPRNYENSDKDYPVFYVFDADYMFEPVAGIVDYYGYWEDMPEAIIIGVNQGELRENDCYYSEQNSLPAESGAEFFDFVGTELVPFVDRNFRTENFKVAVGHGKTANFINYFLLKSKPLFQSYIVLSPDLAKDMPKYVSEALAVTEQKTFYYLATSKDEVSKIQQKTEALAEKLKTVENSNVMKNFVTYEDASHYTMPVHAMGDAIEKLFLVFQPISKKEYKETILKLDGNPVDYLKEKYQMIEDLFGIEKPILINDFKAIEAAIKKKEDWIYFEQLGELARDQYPDTLLGNYYLGRFYEETGKPKKAMKTYQSAYILSEIGGISKDLVLELADQIKADFGY